MTVPAKKDWRDDWPRLLVIGAFVVVAIAALSRPPEPRSQPSAPRDDPAAELHEQYGGSLAAYQRIFALSSCAALIDEYDAQLTAEAGEVAGTSAAYRYHGYGRAAAQRMIALDC